MAEKQGVKVEIFEQAYHLRVNNEADAAQVRRTAALVDAKIRAVAAQTRDVDSLRLAVLAALTIADEYHTLQARYDSLRTSVERKSAELGKLLDAEIRNAS